MFSHHFNFTRAIQQLKVLKKRLNVKINMRKNLKKAAANLSLLIPFPYEQNAGSIAVFKIIKLEFFCSVLHIIVERGVPIF